MKKSIVAILGIGILLYPLICFSSYIIHLKDGREFATDRYYEEGDQIKFKRYGGVIGIQKDLVREIEVVEEIEELPVEKEKTESAKEGVSQPAKKEGAEKKGGVEAERKVKAAKEEAPEKVAKEQEKPGEVSEEEKRKAEQEKVVKIETFLEEKRRLNYEMKKVYSEFKEAKARKDREALREHFSKLKSLRDKLTELEQKVRAAYGGKLPGWWKDAG